MVAFRGLCDSEVDELRGAGFRDENVLRRDITMDDVEQSPVFAPELVRRMQPGARSDSADALAAIRRIAESLPGRQV